jgi:hypothetical protein
MSEAAPSKTKTAGSRDPAIQNTAASKLAERKPSARLHHGDCRRRLLLDLALQFERPGRQFGRLGLDQKRVETAAVIDGFDGVGRNPQPDVPPQRVGNEGDVAQVRQEPALGLDIGVAHLVAHQRALGRQFTAPRHRTKSSSIPPSVPF